MIIVRILVNNILLIAWFTTRVTQHLPHMDLELCILPEHLSSHPVFSGVRVARSLVLICSVLQIIYCSFVLFHLVIVVVCLLSTYQLRIFTLSLPTCMVLLFQLSRTSGNNDFYQYLNNQIKHCLLPICCLKSSMNVCLCSTFKVSMHLDDILPCKH